LVTVEFAFNNKIYIVTKLSPFKINYERKLRMGFKMSKKRKQVKAKKFVKKIKKMYKKAKAIFKKLQKKYANRNEKEAVKYKVGDKVLLSIQNLIWQMRNRKMKKLTEKFVRPYKIKKIISENVVKLELLTLMKIHLVVNVSRIAIY